MPPSETSKFLCGQGDELCISVGGFRHGQIIESIHGQHHFASKLRLIQKTEFELGQNTSTVDEQIWFKSVEMTSILFFNRVACVGFLPSTSCRLKWIGHGIYVPIQFFAMAALSKTDGWPNQCCLSPTTDYHYLRTPQWSAIFTWWWWRIVTQCRWWR